MKVYECESKTEAVNFALKKLDRLARLKKFAKGATRSRNSPRRIPEEIRSRPCVSGFRVDPVAHA